MNGPVIVQGTLKLDGTLELDQKPNLLPGRVTVALTPSTGPSGLQEGWWPYMQRVRAQREAEGYPFMDAEAMEARVRELRDDEDRVGRICDEMQEARREQEKP